MTGIKGFPALLESFFTERLMRQRKASPHTIASYRDTFRLLLSFAERRLKKRPSELAIEDLDTPFLGAFLDHLEQERKNSARSNRLSHDGLLYLLNKHLATARQCCPSLIKKRVTPHVLRHTAAMTLLQNGVDRAVIALWLGHESVETTYIYLHADLELKQQALAMTTPTNVPPANFQPNDQLLSFLNNL